MSLSAATRRGSAPPLRVAVTGASGFSGSHIARLLVRRGMAVVAPVRNEASADGLRRHGIEAVVMKEVALPDGLDAVVHAAATSPAAGIDSARIVTDNVDLTRRLIDQATAGRVSRFVFLSSASVYGEVGVGVLEETTPSVNPDVYGMAKRIGESLLEESGPSMARLAIRLPAVVGHRADRHWLANTVAKLAAGAEVPIFNAGAAYNNAVHIDDLGGLIAETLLAPREGFDIVNVASAGLTTVAEAVEILRRGLGSRSKIVERAAPKGSFTISIDRARDRFGFRPMTIVDTLERYARDVVQGGEAA